MELRHAVRAYETRSVLDLPAVEIPLPIAARLDRWSRDGEFCFEFSRGNSLLRKFEVMRHIQAERPAAQERE